MYRRPEITSAEEKVYKQKQIGEFMTTWKDFPSPPEPATEPSCDDAHAQGAPARISWARLLKRVFDIDIKQCPNCGGALKIIAAIEDPPVIIKILRAPRRSGSIFSKRPESRNRLPTQSIAAARSEFERAARRRANRALPSSCAAGTSRSKTAIFTQLLCA